MFQSFWNTLFIRSKELCHRNSFLKELHNSKGLSVKLLIISSYVSEKLISIKKTLDISIITINHYHLFLQPAKVTAHWHKGTTFKILFDESVVARDSVSDGKQTRKMYIVTLYRCEITYICINFFCKVMTCMKFCLEC